MITTFNQQKVLTDLQECINDLSKLPQDTEIRDTIGVLRRCAFEIEGITNIWTNDMSNYQKAVAAIERGFDIREQHPNGILILYLGYYLWELTDTEIKALKALSKSRKESHEHQNDT